MRLRRIRGYSGQGFTLMEVLVALVITSAVLTAAFLSFRSTLDLGADLTRRQEEEQMVRMTLRVMRDDVLSLCPDVSWPDKGVWEEAETGETISEFCTYGGFHDAVGQGLGSLGAAGVEHAVRYALRASVDGGVLYRVQRGGLGLDGVFAETEQALCDHVDRLTMTLESDDKVAESKLSLHPGKDDVLPDRVRVHLELLTADGSTRAYDMLLPISGYGSAQ